MSVGRKNADSRLLACLATGATLAQASLETGLSESTISRRMNDPAFRTELEKIKDSALSSAVAKLSAISTEAVATLQALLSCKSPAVRLGAARSILELSTSMRAAAELQARLTKLEERQIAMDLLVKERVNA